MATRATTIDRSLMRTLAALAACMAAGWQAPAVVWANDDAIVCCERRGRLHLSHKSDCTAAGTVVYEPGEARTVHSIMPHAPDEAPPVSLTYGPVHACGRTYGEQIQRLSAGGEWRIGAAWSEPNRQSRETLLRVEAGRRVRFGSAAGVDGLVLEAGASAAEYALRLVLDNRHQWELRVYDRETLKGGAGVNLVEAPVTALLAISLDPAGDGSNTLRVDWMDKRLQVPFWVE